MRLYFQADAWSARDFRHTEAKYCEDSYCIGGKPLIF